MAVPESAPRRALHDEDAVGETQRAGVTRARAGPSVPDRPDDATTLTERNLRRLRERWGVPIEEPATPPVSDLGDGGFGWREIMRGLGVHVHLYRDPLPSMRAVRADYKTGLEEARQQSATAVALYRLFGLPGQGLGYLFRFLAVTCDRGPRFAGLLIIVVLLTGSLWWADLI